jgi:flagellar biogenesis protein FliO
MYISMIFSVIIMVLFVVAIYYGGRWIKKRYAVNPGNKQIRIIDRVMLGQDKSIVIADILSCKYIIGISGQQMTLIKDLGEIELPEIKPAGQEDFAAVFGELLKKQAASAKDWISSRRGMK